MSSESVCQVAHSWVDMGSFHTSLFGVVYMKMLVAKDDFETSVYEYSAATLSMLFDVTLHFGNPDEAEASYSVWSQILAHFSFPPALNIEILQ
jgi:hypothetical protein